MAVYVLIGGRSINKVADFALEDKIFRYLGISNPNILFIPFADYKDNQNAIDKFNKLTENYECNIRYLKADLAYALADNLFNWADIIYFSGGCFNELIKIVKEGYLLELLLKYQNSEKIYAGISAGAMLYVSSGMGDRDIYTNNYNIYNYKMIDGLGLVNITICPHYDHNGLEIYNDIVKQYNCDGYALEDDTAIVIGDKIEVFKMSNNKSVYLFDSKDNYIMKPLYEGNKR